MGDTNGSFMAAIIYKYHKRERGVKNRRNRENWPSFKRSERGSEELIFNLRSEDWIHKEVGNRLILAISHHLRQYHYRLSHYYLLPGFFNTLLIGLLDFTLSLFLYLCKPNHTALNLWRAATHTMNKPNIPILGHKMDPFYFLALSQSTFPKLFLPYKSPCWFSNMPSIELSHMAHFFSFPLISVQMPPPQNSNFLSYDITKHHHTL